jgi:hypothetical protein
VQQTLRGLNVDAPFRVYAVWFKMYPGDARERWRAELLTDARVRHYWDEQRSVGRLYLQTLPRIWPVRAAETVLPQADALWDAYLLYPADARWDEQPPDVISWGATILQTKESLDRDVRQALKP